MLLQDSILVSIPYVPCMQLAVTSNTGPILVGPGKQPFGSDDFSSLGKVYSRQTTDKIVRILQCLSSSSTVRHQLLSRILHQYKI